jgi:hypothetical protein
MSVKYIGLDVHQATTVAAVLDAHGKVVMECVLKRKHPRCWTLSAVCAASYTLPWKRAVGLPGCAITPGGECRVFDGDANIGGRRTIHSRHLSASSYQNLVNSTTLHDSPNLRSVTQFPS